VGAWTKMQARHGCQWPDRSSDGTSGLEGSGVPPGTSGDEWRVRRPQVLVVHFARCVLVDSQQA